MPVEGTVRTARGARTAATAAGRSVLKKLTDQKNKHSQSQYELKATTNDPKYVPFNTNLYNKYLKAKRQQVATSLDASSSQNLYQSLLNPAQERSLPKVLQKIKQDPELNTSSISAYLGHNQFYAAANKKTPLNRRPLFGAQSSTSKISRYFTLENIENHISNINEGDYSSRGRQRSSQRVRNSPGSKFAQYDSQLLINDQG